MWSRLGTSPREDQEVGPRTPKVPPMSLHKIMQRFKENNPHRRFCKKIRLTKQCGESAFEIRGGKKKKKIGISSSKATKIDPRKEVSKPQTIGLVLKRKKRTYVFLLRAWLQREKIIFVLIWVFFLCGKCRSPG